MRLSRHSTPVHAPLVDVMFKLGKYCYRRGGSDIWHFADTRIDLLLDFIREELGLPFLGSNQVFKDCHLDSAVISKIRMGRAMPSGKPVRLTDNIYTRLSVMSGIPVSELRWIMDDRETEHMPVHPNARKEQQ